MAKAMLIMDMPSSCENCMLCYNTLDFRMCLPLKKSFLNNVSKPTWCPLREVPQKKDTDNCKTELYRGKCVGYNACIDVILGGGE